MWLRDIALPYFMWDCTALFVSVFLHPTYCDVVPRFEAFYGSQKSTLNGVFLKTGSYPMLQRK